MEIYSIEEKKTIEFLNTFCRTEIDYCKLEKADVLDILNVIQKQEKAIDMLMPYVLNRDISEDYCDKVEDEYCNKVGIGHCYECIKQYFYRKVEDNE